MVTETYSICDVVVELGYPEPHAAAAIRGLWQQLFSLKRKEDAPVGAPTLRLRFEAPGHAVKRGILGEKVWQSPHLRVLKTREGFYLQSGASDLNLNLLSGSGVGLLAEEFWQHPLQDQREFFLLSLAMLLRRQGLYGLHASGLVKEGRGLLIVGSSGVGKTTLTLGLVREGWTYLSDDALMLRKDSEDITALAFRRGFSCTPATVMHFPELSDPGMATWPLKDGKRLVDIDSLYRGRFTSRCHPQVVLFPQIVAQPHSQLVPVDKTTALISLIRESVVINADHAEVRKQLEVLKLLLQQVVSYQLLTGTDVYQNPAAVSEVIWAARSL